MRNILSASGRVILDDYARHSVLVGFDFDGTLAPLNRDRDNVHLSDGVVALLKRLSACCPVAVISGRGRADLAARLKGTGVRHLVGNHGLEPSIHRGECQAWTREVASSLARALRTDIGVELEDKGSSLSLHWTNARDVAFARSMIAAAIAALPMSVRIIDGKGSLSLLKPGASDKGQGIHTLALGESVERVIYVGNDETDEDVFRSPAPAKLLGVRVGPSSNSAARYYLPEQSQIAALLEALIAARPV